MYRLAVELVVRYKMEVLDLLHRPAMCLTLDTLFYS